MTTDINLSDDEIDIRALLNTLFRYKWIILGITVVAALIVFIYSTFGQPKSYGAQAQVLITKPLYTTNLETRIQGVPQTPEAGVLKDLALADDLLWSVYSSSEVTPILEDEQEFDQFKEDMTTKLAGTSKLILSVSAAKPETAAIIVNVWAEKFTAQINSLYGVSEKILSQIESETQNARQKWDAAEQALIEKMPDGIVDTKKIVLENKKNTLKAYLDTITEVDLISRDAQSLQSRLADLPASSLLSVEYQLSLIDLYQRAVRGLEGTPVQVTELNTLGDRTVSDANASLDALITSLESQAAKLHDKQVQLEQEITDATLALETANYQLTQLTTQRDLALNAYQALSAQREETQIDLARDDLTAKVASWALPPQQSISNHTLIKTVIAGILALACSCFGVLFIHWWRSPTLGKFTG